MCERWLNSFEHFMTDMGPRPAGTTLDRINNDGNYEPGNCRWATWSEQHRNTRRTKLLSFRGETKCQSDWAAATGLSAQLINQRLKNGWSVERTLTEPVAPGRGRPRKDR